MKLSEWTSCSVEIKHRLQNKCNTIYTIQIDENEIDNAHSKYAVNI